jgi:Zn-dependent alcohol dehydrogenase
MNTPDDSRNALLEKIRDGIHKSDASSASLKVKNSRYIVIGIVASGLSTVIAASAAALGPVIGQGAPAWKLTCAAVALCTGVATVFTGLQKQLSIAERLAKATACSGRLHSLEFALTVNGRPTVEVAKEYETTIASYSDVIL